MTCPLCHTPSVEPFYCRTDVPVHENMVYTDPGAARSMPRGELRLVCCPACGFIFNTAFDAALVHYDANYDNAQTFSPAFSRHVDDIVREMVVVRGVRDQSVVEIGCGDGEFVRRLVAFPGSGLRGFGFDPSYAGPAADLGGRVEFRSSYYDDQCAEIAADTIVSRHMIEHVPDPVGIFRIVHAATASSKCARVFVETRTVDWALDHASVWDFVYEACSYFTAASLTGTLARAGFRVKRADRVFEGQYLLVEADRASAPVPFVDEPAATPARAAAFGRRAPAIVDACRQGVETLARNGAVVLWGAGTKGMTFANLVDPDGTRAACVVDLGPHKQGCFMPGTGHPIVAPDNLDDRVRSVVVMNPYYREEIATRAGELGLDVDVLVIDDLVGCVAAP